MACQFQVLAHVDIHVANRQLEWQSGQNSALLLTPQCASAFAALRIYFKASTVVTRLATMHMIILHINTHPSDCGQVIVQEQVVCLVIETPLAHYQLCACILALLHHVLQTDKKEYGTSEGSMRKQSGFSPAASSSSRRAFGSNHYHYHNQLNCFYCGGH